MGTGWVLTRQNKAFSTQTKQYGKNVKVLDTLGNFKHYKMKQNMKIPARNEKVACSSQVTSSMKKP
jgi:hypothetical protein